MALDDYLKNTMSGTSPLPNISPPVLSGNTDRDISTLQGKYNPGGIANFQSLMQNVAKSIYDKRQSSELASAEGQVDPSKVSGGTFASILSYMEQNRGKSISKVYASTMDAYKDTQSQIREDLIRLKTEKQRQKERIQTLMAQAPGAKIKEGDSWSTAVAKMRKWDAKQLEDEKEAKKANAAIKSSEKQQTKDEQTEKDFQNDIDEKVNMVTSGKLSREDANTALVNRWGNSAQNIIYSRVSSDNEARIKAYKEATSTKKDECSDADRALGLCD